MKKKNDRRFDWDELGILDKLVLIVFVIVTPWNWLLAAFAWMSNREHLCDIEDKIDELKSEKEIKSHVTHVYTNQPIDMHGICDIFPKDTIGY